MLITVTNNQKKIPRTLAITAKLKVWNTTWTLIKINNSETIRNKQQKQIEIKK